MKKYYSILLIFCVTISLTAQVRQEKDYSQSFAAPNDAKIEIVNKYGEVIIRTWQYDSVRFDVTVKAEGKSSSVIAKSMARVDIKFRKVGSVIAGITEISKGSGFFGNVLNEVEGVVGNNKLKIDYQVWLPAGVLLTVENKYGNLYMADMDGKVELDVSHGDIKANDFKSTLSLKHSFGKSSFGALSEGIFKLRGSEIHVEDASHLNVESASSEIRLDKVRSVQFNSRNDKIHLLDVDEVIGEGSFTDINVDALRNTANLDFSYGDIYLSKIAKAYKSINITGKSTDINLILNQASYIKTYIKAAQDRMILPNSMLTLQKELFPEEDKISLSGFVGNTNDRHSQLQLEADGGELIIAIKDTPIFVDRN